MCAATDPTREIERAINSIKRTQLDRWPEETSPDPAVCGDPDSSGIVGESAAIWNLRARLRHLAAEDTGWSEDKPPVSPVLVVGQTSTGKSLVARGLHDLSVRAGSTFLHFNAASLQGEKFSAELFGFSSGRFADARDGHVGYLAQAGAGTLFIDEFGERTPEEQRYLNTVLDTGRYRRWLAGPDEREERVKARLVMATRPDRSIAHDSGLRAERISMPALADRRADIPLLVRHALLRRGHSAKPSLELIECLVRQPLKGAFRELEKIVKDALRLGRGEEWLYAPPLPAPLPLPRGRKAGQFSREEILAAARSTASDGDAADFMGLGPPDREDGTSERRKRARNFKRERDRFGIPLGGGSVQEDPA